MQSTIDLASIKIVQYIYTTLLYRISRRPVEIKRKLCTTQRIILLSSYLQVRIVAGRKNVASFVLQQLWVAIGRLTKIAFISYLLYCFKGSQITRYPISDESSGCIRVFSYVLTFLRFHKEFMYYI